MAKQTVVMSLSVPPAVPGDLKAKAVSKGYPSRSTLACALFDDFSDMSIQTHDSLRRAAEKRGVPVHELVEFLVDRFPLEDDDVKPIVLKVPVVVMKDPVLLKTWLDRKVAALINHLHPK